MITNSLLNSYKSAIYKVYTEDGIIEVCPQQISKEIKYLHAELRVSSSAVITAYNPFSLKTGTKLNELAQSRLLTKVIKEWRVLSAEGADPLEQWEPEPSLLILGIGLNEAISIGKDFKQNAILFVCETGHCELYDGETGLPIA